MLVRIIFLALLGVLGLPSPAQSPTRPAFEVVSVKLNKDCEHGRGPASSPGRLNLSCVPLGSLIQLAYADGPSLRRVYGQPPWINDMYDITATAAGNVSVDRMRGPMLQVLLEDRFHLKIHRETRDAPIYTLTVAKRGLKLKPLKDDASCSPDCGRTTSFSDGANLTVVGHGVTMDEFAGHTLSLHSGRPVIDKTRLTARFDLHLEYTSDSDTAAGDSVTPPDSVGPALSTALEQQLGLRLSADHGPVEVLVIDHLERPSGN